MIDIKNIETTADQLRTALKNRSMDFSSIDRIVELNFLRKELVKKGDSIKSERNDISKKIGALKASGQDASELMSRSNVLAQDVAIVDAQLNNIEAELKSLALLVPNTPLPDVPVGFSEEENVVVRKSGTPRAFEFEPKPHWDIGSQLDILDNERAAKLSGARFNVFKGDLARLQRSLISYMIDMHTQKHGFKEVFSPVLVLSKTCQGSGQLPKFAGDMYKIEGEDMFLVSTNEITLVNLHSDETLPEENLPVRYTGFALCFRKEAGAAGRDTRGMIRVHQFEKVEMVTLCKPEESEKELQHLVSCAGDILDGLGLPYRVSLLCTTDMSGFSAAKSYDLEVWMPSYNKYVEISSCSNCTDFQARRAGIRYKEKQGKKAEFVHTLNGSGLAIGRTMAAIMENYQNDDGSITVPPALVPYMGCQVIK
ncbi:MAG: serine--tRNA ligase [Caldiserica bacterium]|nr:serine--tRNA ligase [Caldisericota bacterium]